jgi:hypothetical protein
MVATVASPVQIVEAETQKLLDWVDSIEASDDTIFHKAQRIATRLGAYYRPDGLTEIGFWTPELAADMIQPKNIYLEVFTAKKQVDPTKPTQKVIFHRDYVQLAKHGDYHWGVIAGLRPGSQSTLGSLYWLRYLCFETNEVKVVGDCLAHSYPYGVYAPAELYDMDRVQRDRADLAYFEQGDRDEDGIIRVHAPSNILQLHVNTASPNGYLSGLTQVYRDIATKLQQQIPLTAAEQNFIGYDAVQLLPIEPTVEYRGPHDWGHGFFIMEADDWGEMDLETEGIEYEPDDIKVTLKKPDTQNWGYDIVIFGCSATDPSVLETLRPDELVEFIATLHNFPTGPIQVIYDIVYGHADNQAIDLLNGRFLKGPNMYGQDVNHQNPVVRAILLEMQRRKNNTGADGIRVDGAQDFKFFNPLSGRVEYDDQYLSDMTEVLQSVGGTSGDCLPFLKMAAPGPQRAGKTFPPIETLWNLNPRSFSGGR